MKLIEDWLKALQITNIDLELMKSAFTHGSFKGLGQDVDELTHRVLLKCHNQMYGLDKKFYSIFFVFLLIKIDKLRKYY